MDSMSPKKEYDNLGPFLIGEHFLVSLTLGTIAERHASDSPLRAKLETWAKENIPILIKHGNSTGDILAALENYVTHLKALLSQKEAECTQAERATGVEANKRAIQKALAAGDIKRALEEKAFFVLNWDRWHDLKHRDIQKLIDVAGNTCDQRLLIRLGRALEKKAKTGFGAIMQRK